MSRAEIDSLEACIPRWRRGVWFAVIAALLCLRFAPPVFNFLHPPEVLLKHNAAHDKRPCVQRMDTVLKVGTNLAFGVPVIARLDFLRHHGGSKARECNTTLYNRPPPLA